MYGGFQPAEALSCITLAGNLWRARRTFYSASSAPAPSRSASARALSAPVTVKMYSSLAVPRTRTSTPLAWLTAPPSAAAWPPPRPAACSSAAIASSVASEASICGELLACAADLGLGVGADGGELGLQLLGVGQHGHRLLRPRRPRRRRGAAAPGMRSARCFICDPVERELPAPVLELAAVASRAVGHPVERDPVRVGAAAQAGRRLVLAPAPLPLGVLPAVTRRRRVPLLSGSGVQAPHAVLG